MKYKLSVDSNLCIGCGNCELLNPKLFKIVNEKAEVIKEEISELDDARELELSCPMQSIRILKINHNK